MEFWEEEFIDPRDNEPAILELPEDTIKIFEKRGLFPTLSGLIDDTYYTTRKEITRHTHLKGGISVQKLINMSFEELERILFMKDSVMGMPVTFFFFYLRWAESFGGNNKFYDVNPFFLEPYTAKYVRAINRCGMKTFYSCDGWHKRIEKSKELVMLFRDRYSWSWHKIICKLINTQEYCCWEYEKEGVDYIARIRLHREDEKKIQVYNRLLLAADKVVENCVNFKKMKESFISCNHGFEMDMLSDYETEKRMRDFMINYSREDLL